MNFQWQINNFKECFLKSKNIGEQMKEAGNIIGLGLILFLIGSILFALRQTELLNIMIGILQPLSIIIWIGLGLYAAYWALK